jgi:hypothetical protein
MGVYIYTLRRSAKHVVTLDDGRKVYPYKYSARLEHSWDAERAQRAWMDRFLGSFPTDLGPCLTCEGDDERTGNAALEPGVPVYRQEDPEPFWYDCDPHRGKLVGFLRPKGGPRSKWGIVTLGQEIKLSLGEVSAYIVDNGVDLGDFADPSLAGEPIAALDYIYQAAYRHFKAKYSVKTAGYSYIQVPTNANGDYHMLDRARYINQLAQEVKQGKLTLAKVP